MHEIDALTLPSLATSSGSRTKSSGRGGTARVRAPVHLLVVEVVARRVGLSEHPPVLAYLLDFQGQFVAHGRRVAPRPLPLPTALPHVGVLRVLAFLFVLAHVDSAQLDVLVVVLFELVPVLGPRGSRPSAMASAWKLDETEISLRSGFVSAASR